MAIPFQHRIKLHGPQGEIVRLNPTYDDGAMMNVVDLHTFQTVKHCLNTPEKSNHIMCMANGRLVPSAGVWTGNVTAGDISHEGAFEIFDSNGAWSVLFGKPLLKKFKAVYNYDPDIITIPKGNNWTTLQNQHQSEGRTQPLLPVNGNPNNNQHINFKGDHCASPMRQVSHNKQSSEPVNVATSHTDLPTIEDQDIKNTLTSKEITIPPPGEQDNHSEAQHPLTQDGNKRCTMDKCARWKIANGLKEKRS
jgi:hypothetical protein